MSPRLSEAINALCQLPEADQDRIALLILEELADQKRWDEAFDRSQPQLGRLASKVEADVAGGRVRMLDNP